MKERGIALFFSHGTTLRQWHASGIWSREIGYLARLALEFGPVTLFPYDDAARDRYQGMDGGADLRVCGNRWGLPFRIYGLLAPLLHLGELRRHALLRTTQLSGAWTAVLARRLTGRPLALRCGYVRSLVYEREGLPGWRVALARHLERLAVRHADCVFTATVQDAEYLQALAGVKAEKFTLLPNPIDTVAFSPGGAAEPWAGKLLFVGRLHAQKNLPSLIAAVQQEPGLQLDLIGEGPLGEELRNRCAPDGRVHFLGTLPNRDLPEHLAACDVFVLPSRYEGNPKALLEAMSCGCAVVGTRAPGIAEVIEHGRNGLLCDGSPAGLLSAIRRFETEPELRTRCRQAARQHILEHYDIDKIVKREAGALRRLTGDRSVETHPAEGIS